MLKAGMSFGIPSQNMAKTLRDQRAKVNGDIPDDPAVGSMIIAPKAAP